MRDALRSIAGLLAPPLCAVCGRPCAPAEPVCGACSTRLARAPAGRAVVAGVGLVTWAAPYAGIASELVAALKFHSRLGLAESLAAALVDACAGEQASWIALAEVVAVPPAPARLRRRGFDPAELIATALALRLGRPSGRPLARANGPRQVGRSRHSRRSAAPRVRAVGPAPRRVLLVDDVLTTGATLAACAGALRRGGAVEIEAAVFARALGASSGWA